MEIEFWETSSGRSPVAEFITDLPIKTKKKVIQAIDNVETYGTKLVHEGKLLIKLVGYDLYELRIQINKIFYRILLVFINTTAWLLNAFKKKSNNTPQREINTALKRYQSLKYQLNYIN